MNSALAKTDAVLAGFDDALLMNGQGHVCEASVANVFMSRGGVVVTPPVTDDVLEGFTRATVMQLLREELGHIVVERSIDRTELYLADEVFLTGTGVEISPVTRIDHRAVGDGRVRIPRYRHWCRPVYGAASRATAASAASVAAAPR